LLERRREVVRAVEKAKKKVLRQHHPK